MKYSYMDSRLIDINMIKDVHSIISFDLLDPSSSNNKLIGFTASVTLMDGRKTELTYFSNDLYYVPFVNKLIDFYNNNSSTFIDNDKIVLELNKTHRRIDKRSKELFQLITENLLTEKVIKLFGPLEKKDYSHLGYSSSIDSLLNYLLNELKKIFSYLNEEVEIIYPIHTFNDNFSIKIKRNNKIEYIPVIYECIDEVTHRFTLGNVFKPGYVCIDISFREDKTLIMWENKTKGLTSFTEVMYELPFVKRDSLYSYEQALFYNEEYLKEVHPEKCFKAYFDYINEDINKFAFYKIDDNIYYAVETKTIDYGESKEVHKRIIRISIREDKLYINEEYIEEVINDNIRVYTNSFIMDSSIINGVIETEFKKSNYSSSAYKNTLERKVVTTKPLTLTNKEEL